MTCTVPGMAMSAAEIGLVTCDVLTNAAVAVPESGLSGLDQTTAVPEMKLLPFTVSVKPGSPAVTLEGDSEEIEGVGPMGIGPPNDDPPPPPQAGQSYEESKYHQAKQASRPHMPFLHSSKNIEKLSGISFSTSKRARLYTHSGSAGHFQCHGRAGLA